MVCSFAADLARLKEKVDAGADFVMCQYVYDADTYASFVYAARECGITVPIIPGVLPIYTVDLFRRLNSATGVRPPSQLEDDLRALVIDLPTSHCEAQVSRPSLVQKFDEFRVTYTSTLCRQLLDCGAPGIHFFTLNIASVIGSVLSSLGLTSTASRRQLPWRPSKCAGREREEIR